jgi:hypothetical protein
MRRTYERTNMKFVISIRPTNADIVMAWNDGVYPQPQHTTWGGLKSLYLVVEPGKENRVIDHDEMWAMVQAGELKKTSRQFYFG